LGAGRPRYAPTRASISGQQNRPAGVDAESNFRLLCYRTPKPSGKRLGRQPGQRPKSDRLAPKVLALVAQGRSYRLVGHEVGLSKNTVADIGNRMRASLA